MTISKPTEERYQTKADAESDGACLVWEVYRSATAELGTRYLRLANLPQAHHIHGLGLAHLGICIAHVDEIVAVPAR
jgi:hypothetical protein